MLCERLHYGSIWINESMLCIKHIIWLNSLLLHHASVIIWLNAVHPWFNAIRLQYVAQCSASGINTYGSISLSDLHHPSIWLSTILWFNFPQWFASCINTAQYYTMAQCCESTTQWCASGINMAQCHASGINMAWCWCIRSSKMCIRHQYCLMLCIRHQNGSILLIAMHMHHASLWLTQCCASMAQWCAQASVWVNAVHQASQYGSTFASWFNMAS